MSKFKSVPDCIIPSRPGSQQRARVISLITAIQLVALHTVPSTMISWMQLRTDAKASRIAQARIRVVAETVARADGRGDIPNLSRNGLNVKIYPEKRFREMFILLKVEDVKLESDF
jgi:hypothetical protein